MKRSLRQWVIMATLSFSGGVIFILPFLQVVYYEPLTLALELNNVQVGTLMSVFGATSMISYLPGGWLADRVSPRWLISISLIGTGLGGLYFATFPGYTMSLAIHGFWGVSIALLFWGAMIRATREWGGKSDQGKAFGILESGRGIGEIVGYSGLLIVFGWLGAELFALSTIVIILSSMLIALGALAFFTLESGKETEDSDAADFDLGVVIKVLKMPVVWFITLIIMTGYCGYWGIMRATPYASDVFMMSAALAATVATASMWLKPVAALISGWLADKVGISVSVATAFAILVCCFLAFSFMPGGTTMIPYMLVNLSLASIAIFAMRAIYFALLDEGGVPMAVTGTATGVISVLGFTPDIFIPPLNGWLLDNFPGDTGHRYFFMIIAAICVAGLVASIRFHKRFVKNPTSGDD